MANTVYNYDCRKCKHFGEHTFRVGNNDITKKGCEIIDRDNIMGNKITSYPIYTEWDYSLSCRQYDQEGANETNDTTDNAV